MFNQFLQYRVEFVRLKLRRANVYEDRKKVKTVVETLRLSVGFSTGIRTFLSRSVPNPVDTRNSSTDITNDIALKHSTSNTCPTLE